MADADSDSDAGLGGVPSFLVVVPRPSVRLSIRQIRSFGRSGGASYHGSPRLRIRLRSPLSFAPHDRPRSHWRIEPHTGTVSLANHIASHHIAGARRVRWFDGPGLRPWSMYCVLYCTPLSVTYCSP